ncbi:MAG: hypothetical protein KY393_05885 [Actinobacteria bacterium]|nr:hypothetical protein [Actinomycetota bacterium]
MSTKPEKEMTWVKAIVLSTVITAALIIVLGFLPSILRYEWEANSAAIGEMIHTVTGYELQDTYTLVRIHDAISMGIQTFIFAIPVVATYIIGEKRRRRMGLRGSGAVKGYLPGK